MSDRSKRKTASQPPVSAHPAFPVIVALWFAALFSIGSMVLPLSLFEGFAVASGLADGYAAAQPPLGATARIVVAAIGALIGAGAGLFVARRIAAAHARPVTRRAAALRGEPVTAAAKRPISAHEELGEGGLDVGDADELPMLRATLGTRRRALAVNDESARSDFLDFAPLPGQQAAAEAEPASEVEAQPEEPLDLVAFAATEEEPAEEPQIAPAPFQAPSPPDFGTASLSRRFAAPTDFAAPVAPAGPIAAAPIAEPPIADTAAPIAERALGDLGMVELVERFAHALQSHKAAAAPRAEATATEAALPISDEPVSGEETTAATPATEFSFPPLAIPAALRPFEVTDEDDEADVSDGPAFDLSIALAHGRTAHLAAAEPTPFEPVAAEGPDQEDETVDDSMAEDYSSLLAMKTPFAGREPLRMEDEPADDDAMAEPVVVFPGQALRRPVAIPTPIDPAAGARPFDPPLARAEQAAAAGRPSARATAPVDTERALRDALEKLQRLSGVA